MNETNLKARLLELTQTIRTSEWLITSEIERLPWENEALNYWLRTDTTTKITSLVTAAKDAAERLCAFFTTKNKETKANDTSPVRNAVVCIRNIATYLADVLAYTPDLAQAKNTVVFDNIEQFLSEINGHVNTIRKELDIPEKVKVEPVQREVWYAIVGYTTNVVSVTNINQDSPRISVVGPCASRKEMLDRLVKGLLPHLERPTKVGGVYVVESGNEPKPVFWRDLVTEWSNDR